MEEQLIIDLRADAGIIDATADFGGRALVDWITRPDLSDLPAVTLQRISTDRLYAHDGPVALTGARVQADCWGASYGAARVLARAVMAKMEAGGTGWRAFLQTERDGGAQDIEGGARVFNVSLDFNIWYED